MPRPANLVQGVVDAIRRLAGTSRLTLLATPPCGVRSRYYYDEHDCDHQKCTIPPAEDMPPTPSNQATSKAAATNHRMFPSVSSFSLRWKRRKSSASSFGVRRSRRFLGSHDSTVERAPCNENGRCQVHSCIGRHWIGSGPQRVLRARPSRAMRGGRSGTTGAATTQGPSTRSAETNAGRRSSRLDLRPFVNPRALAFRLTSTVAKLRRRLILGQAPSDAHRGRDLVAPTEWLVPGSVDTRRPGRLRRSRFRRCYRIQALQHRRRSGPYPAPPRPARDRPRDRFVASIFLWWLAWSRSTSAEFAVSHQARVAQVERLTTRRARERGLPPRRREMMAPT